MAVIDDGVTAEVIIDDDDLPLVCTQTTLNECRLLAARAEGEQGLDLRAPCAKLGSESIEGLGGDVHGVAEDHPSEGDDEPSGRLCHPQHEE